MHSVTFGQNSDKREYFKCNFQILYLSSTFYNIATDSQVIRLDYIAVVGETYSV
jgi:hypothetical protein